MPTNEPYPGGWGNPNQVIPGYGDDDESYKAGFKALDSNPDYPAEDCGQNTFETIVLLPVNALAYPLRVLFGLFKSDGQ